MCLVSNKMQRRARLPEAPKPFDLWSYDAPHLLDELAGIREMILRIPVTLQTKSALQSAIDRIWRVEDDVRFLLSLQRDMQRSFAAKAAEFTSDSKKGKQEGPQKNKATATESHKLVGN